ncbi:MAG: 4a-hydroxytetrahydrobiopterin dehydratase [Gilvibacter sp.]
MIALTASQIETKLPELSGWTFTDGVLSKTVTVKDFREAFTLMTRIAFEVEQMNHHPSWTNTYNTIQFKLSTHECEGVSEKDFALANIIDTIIKNTF